MLTKALILLALCGFLICNVYAAESQCASLLSKNLTDKIQSSVVVALIKNAQILLDDANKYATMRCLNDEPVPHKPMDCAEILERNRSANSGVYSIWPRNRMIISPFDVYCDMEDDGGAWTVIQRRGDFGSAQDYFHKDWQAYKSGFGDLNKDFWLGNDNIFALTNQRANVVKFTLTDWEENTAYAIFDEFWIEDEYRNYTLHATGYSGTAGDSLSLQNEQAFTTKDRDNDQSSSNCAVNYKGAWWYNKCHQSNLNGFYFKENPISLKDGIIWFTFKRMNYSLKNTVIKVRPNDFKKK